MKILGIDDNEDINRIFEVAFTSCGHEFTSTVDPHAGLDLIRKNRYDLVLLDLAMPGLSGRDILETLHKEGISNKQRIIVVTASAAIDADLALLKEIGASDCLRKPVDLDELLTVAEATPS